jgi:hypothetical protein
MLNLFTLMSRTSVVFAGAAAGSFVVRGRAAEASQNQYNSALTVAGADGKFFSFLAIIRNPVFQPVQLGDLSVSSWKIRCDN